MLFRSTRSLNEAAGQVAFREAIFQGLAGDGGLFHPTTTPDLSGLITSFSPDISYQQLAEELTFHLLQPEVDREMARKIVTNAYDFTAELRRLDEHILILELFHGPSYAFKDFGACFLASAMSAFLAADNKKAIILVATSGDTGSAVARAFYKKKNIDVVILYPSGRVSPLQEKQLTTLGENIVALEVQGNFDDCQRMVKEAFLDRELQEKLTLTSANSINLGRLIPQAFYYVFAYTRLKQQLQANNIYFTVPSGNFGNLTAGIYAWQWGLPVRGFVAATNINDVVPDYLRKGVFTPRPSQATYSNAMDVGNPSNFERLLAVFGQDWDKMKSMLQEEVVTDTDTLQGIKEVKTRYGQFICPHTAVGYLASRRFLAGQAEGSHIRLPDASSQVVTLSTAHAAKFPEIVEQATGELPVLPPGLQAAMQLPKQSVMTDRTLAALKSFLLQRFA